MKHKIYIIILNYNGWKDTIECLESVLKNDYENYQIIVVDNDSPNNSMEYIINWAKGKQEVIYDENSQLKHLSQPFESKPLEYVLYTKEEALNGGDKEKESKLNNPIIFIQSGENGGFAAGNNIGIKYALTKDDFEYVWLLNNDTVVDEYALYNLVQGFEKYKNQNIGICGSKILFYDEPHIVQSLGRVQKNLYRLSHIAFETNDIYDDDFKVDEISGASMLLSKNYIRDIGFMPEEYFLYMEETDWNYKGKSKGYNFFTIVSSKIFHKESISTGGRYSFTNIYYNTRNKIHFLRKYSTNYIFILIIFIIYNSTFAPKTKQFSSHIS